MTETQLGDMDREELYAYIDYLETQQERLEEDVEILRYENQRYRDSVI